MSSTTAEAATPIVADTCGALLHGSPGQTVAIAPSAVLPTVLNVVRAVPLLGPGLSSGVSAGLNSGGPIDLGTVTDGSHVISGSTVAAAVNQRLTGIPVLQPVLDTVTAGVRTALTAGCSLTVTTVETVVAPVQQVTAGVQPVLNGVTGSPAAENHAAPSPSSMASGGVSPGQPSAAATGPLASGSTQVLVGPGGFGDTQPAAAGLGRVPFYSYGDLPFALPGDFNPALPEALFGAGIPGYLPQLDPLDDGRIDSSSSVFPLPGLGGGREISLPVMCGVLLLAGVMAAVLRAWSLRRGGVRA